MPPARIQSLEFLDPETGLKPESSGTGLRAGLEDGGKSVFFVATADQPGLWLKAQEFSYGAPVLYVSRLDQETVAEAAQAMAAEMSGYWLRYYNSPEKEVSPARPAKGAKKPAAGCKVVSAVISEAYPPRSPEHGCGVVQVRIEDGREFSVLTATPSWFKKAFGESGLRYYYGPSVLFVSKLDPKLVKKAVSAMAAEGDRWLCRYDTPRRTIPEVFSDFKAKHAAA